MYSPEWKKRGVVDAEVLRHKIIYISKFRKDIKPLKIKFRKTIRNGARILSQPNNNHNPNNKTTITVVGLRLSNRWEYHPHHPHHHHHPPHKLKTT